MKKFTCVLAAFLVLTLAGCSMKTSVTLNARWYSNPTMTGVSAIDETLTYRVRYDKSSVSLNSVIKLDYEEGNYVVNLTTMKYPNTNDKFQTTSDVYRLTSTLTINGSIDIGTDSRDFTDKISTCVYFLGVDRKLAPIESTRDVVSTFVDPNGSKIASYSYTQQILYDADTSTATATRVDRAAEDNEYTALGNKELSYNNLSKDHSFFDNEQLVFAARGFSLAAGFSSTVTTIDGSLNRLSVSMSNPTTDAEKTCSVKIGDETKNFDCFGLTIQNGASMNGTGSTVYYAKFVEGNNANHCMPIEITTPLAYNCGNLVYTLSDYAYSENT